MYQLGTRTAFDRSAFNSPSVLYDSRALGKNPPFCSMTLGTSKIAGWLIGLVAFLVTVEARAASTMPGLLSLANLWSRDDA